MYENCKACSLSKYQEISFLFEDGRVKVSTTHLLHFSVSHYLSGSVAIHCVSCPQLTRVVPFSKVRKTKHGFFGVSPSHGEHLSPRADVEEEVSSPTSDQLDYLRSDEKRT